MSNPKPVLWACSECSLEWESEFEAAECCLDKVEEDEEEKEDENPEDDEEVD